MTTEFPKIWTPTEIAQATQTEVKDVVTELEAGRLRGVRIGRDWRITDDAFRAFMAGPPEPTVGNRAKELGGRSGAAVPANAKTQWKPCAKFTYTWPDGTTNETYETAFEADVTLPSGQHHFMIGYTNREAAGMKDRRRVIVFVGHAPRMVPVVEFAGANDFAQTRRLASVIKDSSNRQVRAKSQLPVEYQDMPIVVYSEVVVGPYAARSMAVLADGEDRDLMLRHAIIRARYKGIIRG